MKLTIGLFILISIIGSSLALPAGNPNDDAEILNTSNISENSPQDDVNIKDFESDVVDTRVGDPYYSYTLNPFTFFENFQDTLRRLRDGIERKIWAQAEREDGDDILPIDESKRNSTSTVEIIDGHKIEINETVYANDNGHALFKVRVIQVRPLDLDDNTTSDGSDSVSESHSKTVEDVEDFRQPAENEVNRSVISPEIFKLHNNNSEPELTIYSTILPNLNTPENDYVKKMIDEDHLDIKNLTNEFNFYTIIDTTEQNPNLKKGDYQTAILNDDDDKTEESSTSQVITTTEDEKLEESTTLEAIRNTDKSILSKYSRETLENESSEEEIDGNLNSEWDTLEDNNNPFSNEIEMYNPVEIDLSNDIFVNDLLAGQSAAHNPNAEVFSDVVINFQSNNSKTFQPITIEEFVVPTETNFSSTNIK